MRSSRVSTTRSISATRTPSVVDSANSTRASSSRSGGTRQHANREARPVLLHLQMHQRHVERAGFEEALHQVLEMLGVEVVEVRLQHDDAIAAETGAAPEHGAQHVGQAARSARCPRRSRSPRRCIAGSVQNSSTTARTIAAPVGVTVSQSMPAGTTGHAAQQLERRGRRQRQQAVIGVHRAVARAAAAYR